MKASIDCAPCLLRQAMQAARFAGADEATRERILQRTMGVLQDADWSQSPLVLARRVHQLVREESGAADPYARAKRDSTQWALEQVPRLQAMVDEAPDPLETAVRLSIAGNMADYGAHASFDLESVVRECRAKPFALDHLERFRADLAEAETIGWLADNAGELVFDRILMDTVETLFGPRQFLVVTRSEPFINDALAGEAEASGLGGRGALTLAELTPGVMVEDLEGKDRETWDRLNASDVVVSKGQGNFEAYSEVPGIYFLLAVKCDLVAVDLQMKTGARLAIGDLLLWKSGG